MALLSELPNELIHEIATFPLWPRNSRRILLVRDLAALARVCRRLHDTVNPILYAYNREFHGSSASSWAARYGCIGTLERAHTYGLNIRNPHWGSWGGIRRNLDQGYEPRDLSTLQEAVLQGHYDVVVWLLDHGLQIDSPSSFLPSGVTWGRSALFTAIATKRSSIVFLLLKRGASVQFAPYENEVAIHRREGLKTATALHFAARFGLLSVVRYLLYLGLDVGGEDFNHKTPLHYAAASRDCPDSAAIITLLLDHGADVNAVGLSLSQDSFDQTPLCSAITYGCYRNATTLIQAGADVNLKSGGVAPIQICVQDAKLYSQIWLREKSLQSDEGKYGLLRLLIARGADLKDMSYDASSKTRLNALGWAIQHGTPQTLNILLDGGSNMEEAGEGISAVDHAWNVLASYRDSESNQYFLGGSKLARLLRRGARLDGQPGHDGRGCLERAINEYALLDCRLHRQLMTLFDHATAQNMDEQHPNHLLQRYTKERAYMACGVLLRRGATFGGALENARAWFESLMAARSHMYRDVSMQNEIRQNLDACLEFVLPLLDAKYYSQILLLALKSHDPQTVDALISLDSARDQSLIFPLTSEMLDELIIWGDRDMLRKLAPDRVDTLIPQIGMSLSCMSSWRSRRRSNPEVESDEDW